MLMHQIPCIYYYEPREMRAIEPMKLFYVGCSGFITLPRIVCFLLAHRYAFEPPLSCRASHPSEQRTLAGVIRLIMPHPYLQPIRPAKPNRLTEQAGAVRCRMGGRTNLRNQT